ncbi:MAG: hypothetical protein IPM46_06165 [Flavobacteriales bacterium]|nr:hypothetical protein [Flavobacteriales bacterium]
MVQRSALNPGHIWCFYQATTMVRLVLNALVGYAILASGCQSNREIDTPEQSTAPVRMRCSPEALALYEVEIDYPMTSDTSFTIMLRSDAGVECRLSYEFDCKAPVSAIPRLLIRDNSWVFLSQSSGNYSRSLIAVDLDDCLVIYRAAELLCISTDRDLIALFEHASQNQPSAVRIMNYVQEEQGRIPLPGVLCAEAMACLDSAYFTAYSLRVSFHEDPNGPSSIAELPL